MNCLHELGRNNIQNNRFLCMAFLLILFFIYTNLMLETLEVIINIITEEFSLRIYKANNVS